MTKTHPIDPDHQGVLWLSHRAHGLWLTGLTLLCTALVYQVGPSDWGHPRRVLGGVIAGGGVYLCLFINRVMVWVGEDWYPGDEG